MQLTFERLDGSGRYRTLIVRDDNVRFHVKGVAHAFAIPHDLAHFVVETSLKIEHGFWGVIARGAVFPTMSHLSGRRKPKASERSAALLKAYARDLVEAEIVVRILNDGLQAGRSTRAMTCDLHDRLPAFKFAPADVAAAAAAYALRHAEWHALPTDGALSVHW